MARSRSFVNTIPEKDELASRFETLIDSIVNVIFGRKGEPRFLNYWFLKTVAFKVLGERGPYISPAVHLTVREFIGGLNYLSEEDIRQQASLIIFEVWTFYKKKIEAGKKVRFVFDDYVRLNIIKHISTYVSNQILLQYGDQEVPVFSEEYHIEDPQFKQMNLGWLILKADIAPLSYLNIKEKYLL